MAGRRKKAESMASSSSAPPSPLWVDLPWDITANILGRLGVEEKLVAAQVCTAWRSVCKDPSIWRKIHISRDPIHQIDYEMMCRLAVDWSQGQLMDLSISGFGSNSLLNHIAERSTGLRFLSIVKCDDITEKDVVKATEGLHLLEELRFFCTSEFLGFMGLFCHSFPDMKSLTINWTMDGRQARLMLEDEELHPSKIINKVIFLRSVGKILCNRVLVPLFRARAHSKSLNLELGFNLSISGEVANQVSQQIESEEPSIAKSGCFYDDGFRGEYKMRYRDSTCVRICLVYVA